MRSLCVNIGTLFGFSATTWTLLRIVILAQSLASSDTFHKGREWKCRKQILLCAHLYFLLQLFHFCSSDSTLFTLAKLRLHFYPQTGRDQSCKQQDYNPQAEQDTTFIVYVSLCLFLMNIVKCETPCPSNQLHFGMNAQQYSRQRCCHCRRLSQK